MSLCPHVCRLGHSKHLFVEQRFDLVMTSGNVSSQAEEELGWGSWQGKEGESYGGGGGTGWGTVKGGCFRVPVVSQFRVHALITAIAWGEWRTNTGSEARWGLLVMRFRLTFDPKQLWALCLLMLTRHCWRPPQEFVLDSHEETLAECRISFVLLLFLIVFILFLCKTFISSKPSKCVCENGPKGSPVYF